MPSNDFEGKLALITGGARGQGEAEARLLARRGAAVLIADVLDDAGEALAAELGSDGHAARYIHLDVGDPAAWQAAVTLARGWRGRLDVLVNNAGIINRQTVAATPLEAWERVLRVNLTGAFLGIQAAAPLMAGGGGGAIVNISSNSAFSGHYDPAYTSSKWGLRGLTRSAAMEYAEQGIRVNAICPGLIVTKLNEGGAHLAPLVALTPLGRSGRVEEIAEMVAFLASDAAAYITGEDFTVDGGFTAGAAYRRVAKEAGMY